MAQLAGTTDPTSLAIETSGALADLNAILETELAANSRTSGLAAMAAGMIFAGLALLLSVGSQRRDFGRRRALGASRSLLVSLVLLEGIVPAILGAAGGTALGLVGVLVTTGTLTSARFAASIPVLATLAVLLASLPAALTAAYRDPVSVLRVP